MKHDLEFKPFFARAFLCLGGAIMLGWMIWYVAVGRPKDFELDNRNAVLKDKLYYRLIKLDIKDPRIDEVTRLRDEGQRLWDSIPGGAIIGSSRPREHLTEHGRYIVTSNVSGEKRAEAAGLLEKVLDDIGLKIPDAIFQADNQARLEIKMSHEKQNDPRWLILIIVLPGICILSALILDPSVWK